MKHLRVYRPQAMLPATVAVAVVARPPRPCPFIVPYRAVILPQSYSIYLMPVVRVDDSRQCRLLMNLIRPVFSGSVCFNRHCLDTYVMPEEQKDCGFEDCGLGSSSIDGQLWTVLISLSA